MSNLLQMGTDFEKKLKERAASTENMLNSEFRKLEESVDKALSLNRQKIRDAISEHTTSVKKQLDTLSTTVSMQFSTTEAELSRQQKKLLWRVIKGRILFPALTALSVTGGIFLGCWGLMEWQESKIAKNILTIREQENTLAKLEAKTWGVTFVNGENGKFLVLPDGVKGENTWTVGDKNAVMNEWESAFAELQKMHEVTQRNNAILNERVVILSQQVQRLAGQVDRLSRLFIANNS
ncbi:MbeD family mobilization/exclusion protein [Escherichia coli]|uniref:MbeD family mobilization/exclusion protein n=65 Tax=cellular organisms TaxID=131567 RepID=UPI001E32AF4C